MTQPADVSAVAADHVTSANGPGSLSDRVRGLRLQGQLDGGKGRGSSSAWLPWLLCLLMAVTWASFAVRAYTSGGWKNIFGGSSAQNSGATSTPADAQKKEREKVSTQPAGPDGMVLEVMGYLVAARQIQVGPDRVSGKVTKLDIVEGKFFKEGAPLAEVDTLDYEADYRQAVANRKALKAQLDEMNNGSRPEEKQQAEAQVDEAMGMLDQALRDLYRMETIVAKMQPPSAVEPNRAPREPVPAAGDKKSQIKSMLAQAKAELKRVKPIQVSGQTVSDKEFIQAIADAETRSARLEQMLKNWELVLEGPRREKIEAMAAQLEQAEAREKLAKEMLERCTIRAPVSGLILSKRTEIGNLVNPLAMNTNFNGGICEMADLTDLEVDLEVQERDIRKVFVDQECVVRAKAYPERHYAARVDRIMPVANSSKAIIPIRVKVRVPRAEEGQYLKPQMGADVTFYNRKAPPEPKEPLPPKIVE
jgi:multidrug resistance efflux pump